ncbi:neuronal acetylcholine receptor subunit alpha-10-like [Ruditapes philippinarum]|uniref:neuronal acetylcholine receptor subunit alpha-10-like n=1 Tax=Ruditapes philippinarum TaxID=129788 RepID=UPI00295B6CB9|nr:neuronal acetylcholine receptor subunit alpha-10-like [Ruditapes philippinarum]
MRVMAVFLHYFWFMLAFLQLSEGKGSSNDEATLRNAIFSDYDKYMAPVGDDDGPVVVKQSLHFVKVVSLDNDVLIMQVWEFMKWRDTRLQWDLNTFNIKYINGASKWVWQPDILLVDSLEEYSGFPSGDLLVTIYNDGNVIFVPPRIRKTDCVFSESDLFAQNSVTCSLMYMSWVHSLVTLDLRIDSQPEVLNNDNRKWEVVETAAERNVKTYSCCPDEYVDITYKIQLKRIK